MKNLKFTLSIFSLFLFLGTGLGKSAKLVQKAADKVEKLNNLIVSENAELALNEDQTKQITDLYIKQIKGIRTIKKSGETEEVIKEKKKALNKEINKEIYKNILTKEQRLARKAAKEKVKTKK